MNYYIISDDLYFPNRWQLESPSSAQKEIDPYDFRKGKMFSTNIQLKTEVSPGVPLDFTLSMFDVPIISFKLADILIKHFKEEIQLIPINIDDYKQKYFIVNVLQVIDCLDEKKSVFTKWTKKDGRPDKIGHYRMIGKLRINPLKIPSNVNIFRIDNWTIDLIVSELVKKEIEKNNIKGVLFEKV